MKLAKFYFLPLFLLALAAGGLSALAQESVVNVVEQARYKQLPDGIRSGSLLFYPSLGVEQRYDDNIYRAEDDTESDMVTIVRPSFAVNTDFDLHSLFFRADGRFGFHRDNDSEDYDDFTVAGGGTLDVGYETFFSLYSSYQHLHEARDSTNNTNTDEPVEYDLLTNKLGFTRALGIIQLYLEGIYEKFKFEDSTRGGVPVDNGARDRDIYTTYAKLAYEYFPNYHVFLSGRYDWRKYDEDTGLDRDSGGYEILLGTDLYITGKVRGEIYGGYLERRYDDPLLETVDAFNYGGSVVWNLTGLTSLTGSVSRSVEETIYADASGDLQTRYDIGLDHLLRHNLFFGLDAGYYQSNFESITASGREDDNYTAGFNLEYLPFDGTSLRAGYLYHQRESNEAGRDFTDNRIYLGLSQSF